MTNYRKKNFQKFTNKQIASAIKLLKSSGASIAAGAGTVLNKKAKTKTKSYTKTTLHQHARAEIGSSGGTYSNFYYASNKIPRAFAVNWKALAKNYYTINGGTRFTSTAGLQNANTLCSMFNYTDVSTISARITANNTNKFLLKSVSAEVLLTNQDSGNCNVTIYDIIARKDLATSANLLTPDIAWARSYGDEGATNANWSVPGSTPFSADLFTQFYTVKKITHITMGQGQCHTHRVKYSPNRIIDGEYIQYNTNGFKNLSCYTMVVQHGMPYNDVTTKTQVSLGSTALDFVFKKQYSYTWMEDKDTTYGTINSLPTAFTVNENIMNEATGTATVDTAA
jgi:hypothetical protein